MGEGIEDSEHRRGELIRLIEKSRTLVEDNPLSEKWTWKIGSRTGKLVFVIALLCGAVVSSSEARVICDNQNRITSTRRGFGADCTAAQADLESDTSAEAQGVCQSLGYDGMCIGSSVVVTNACAWNENHMAYKVAGYRTYRCATVVIDEECTSVLTCTQQ